MLSAWTKTVEIYLGQNMAAILPVRSDKHAIITAQETDITLPALLESVQKQLPINARVKIHLSGALCSAVGLQIPKNILRHSEIAAIVNATAIQVCQTGQRQLVCEIARGGMPMAAALPVDTLDAILYWGKCTGLRITAIRPIWSIASKCKAAAGPTVRGLALREPDSTTLLTVLSDGTGMAKTFSLPALSPNLQSARRRWQVSAGLEDRDICSLSFDPRKKQNIGLVPKLGFPTGWSQYWALL